MSFSIVKTTQAALILLFSFTVLVSSCTKDDDGIAGNDSFPTLTFTKEVILNEGDIDETMSVTVTLSGTNNTNAIVSYAAVDGSAVAGIDYIVPSGKLTFAPGETTKSIPLTAVGNEAKESNESFTVVLFNPINCKVGAENIIKVTIADDDDEAAGLVIPTTGTTSPTSYPGYNLVWSDEFTAPQLNMANWGFDMGEGGWGNQELQYYRQENASIVDGHLVITARKQNYGTSNYTSSRLLSKNKKQFKFGRVDIRAALPISQGLWPALWMLGSNIDAASWPSCGEIDIMEYAGHLPNRVVGTVHFGSNVANHTYISGYKYLSGTNNFHDEFHVFSIIWQQDKIEFLVDDEIYHTITPTDTGAQPYPFNSTMFFIMNVAVGGTFPGNPDNTSVFPQHMIVDYIRVFQ